MDLFIVNGNHRVEAAKQLGLKQIRVDIYSKSFILTKRRDLFLNVTTVNQMHDRPSRLIKMAKDCGNIKAQLLSQINIMARFPLDLLIWVEQVADKSWTWGDYVNVINYRFAPWIQSMMDEGRADQLLVFSRYAKKKHSNLRILNHVLAKAEGWPHYAQMQLVRYS